MSANAGRLQGRVAVVAGGSRNIGAAIARLFAAEGATVVIADLREDEGRALAEEIGELAAFSGLDVTDEESWGRLVAWTETSFGPASVLVNNAAIIPFAHLAEMDTAAFDRCLAVNVRGTFLGMRALAGPMTRAGGGSIINLSSVQGLVGLEGTVAYTASKFAVRGMTKVAALELGHHGIRVNSIHPGKIDVVKERDVQTVGVNPDAAAAPIRVPLGRSGLPVDVARLALFLASDESSYATGAEFVLDGGWTAGFRLDFFDP
jgi:3alpha(or 20beta)-hydroxysteroid dehydrogenase